jgi:hypothetical protein
MNLNNLIPYNNHKPCLWMALEATKGGVLEYGMGQGSTPALHEYCEINKRRLLSLENNKEYFDMFSHLQTKYHSLQFVTDWADRDEHSRKYSVVFIDHSPAERRHIDAILFKDNAEIVVVHDCEHEGLGYDVYHISEIAKHFKYRKDFTIKQHAPKTVMFSNSIDVSQLKIPNYTAI